MTLCASCLAAGEAHALVLDDTFHMACPACGLIDDGATHAANAADADSREGYSGRARSAAERLVAWRESEHMKKVGLLIDTYLTSSDARLVPLASPQHAACALAWYDRMRLVQQAQTGGARKTVVGLQGSQRLPARVIVAIRFAIQEANMAEVEQRLRGLKLEKDWVGTGIAVPDAEVAPPNLKAAVESLSKLPKTHVGYFDEVATLTTINKRFAAALHFEPSTLDQVLAHLVVIERRIQRLLAIDDWRERIAQLHLPRLRSGHAHKTLEAANEDDFFADSAAWAFFASVDWPAVLPAALGLYRAQETVSLWGQRPFPGTAVALLYHAVHAVAGREWPSVMFWEDELLAPYGRDHRSAMFRRSELKDLLVCWSTSLPAAGIAVPVVPRPKKGYVGTGLAGYMSDHRRAIPEPVMAVAAAAPVARHWRRIVRARLATRDAALPLDHEYAMAAQAFARAYAERTGHVPKGKKRGRGTDSARSARSRSGASDGDGGTSASESATSASAHSTAVAVPSEAASSRAATPVSAYPESPRGASPMLAPHLSAAGPPTPGASAPPLPAQQIAPIAPGAAGPHSPVVPGAPHLTAPPKSQSLRTPLLQRNSASASSSRQHTPDSSALSAASTAAQQRAAQERNEMLRMMGLNPSTLPARPTPAPVPPIVLYPQPKPSKPSKQQTKAHSASIEAMLATRSDSSDDDPAADSDDDAPLGAPVARARPNDTLFGAVKPGAVYGFSIGPNGFTVEDAPRSELATVPAAARYQQQQQHQSIQQQQRQSTRQESLAGPSSQTASSSRQARSTSAATSRPTSRGSAPVKRPRKILPAPPRPVAAVKLSPAASPGPRAAPSSVSTLPPLRPASIKPRSSAHKAVARPPAPAPAAPDSPAEETSAKETSTRATTPALSLAPTTLRSISPSPVADAPPPPPEPDACHEAVLIREREQYLRYRAATERSSARRAPAAVEAAMQRWVDAAVAAGDMPADAARDAAYLRSIGLAGDPRRAADLGQWARAGPWAATPLAAFLRAGLAPHEVPAHHLVHSVLALRIQLGELGDAGRALFVPDDEAGAVAGGPRALLSPAALDAECELLFDAEGGIDAAYLMSPHEADERERLYLASGTWDYPRDVEERRLGRTTGAGALGGTSGTGGAESAAPAPRRRRRAAGKPAKKSRINEDVLRRLALETASDAGDDDDDAMRDVLIGTLAEAAGVGWGAGRAASDAGDAEDAEGDGDDEEDEDEDNDDGDDDEDMAEGEAAAVNDNDAYGTHGAYGVYGHDDDDY